MRRLTHLTVVGVIGVNVAAVAAQKPYPVFTADDFVRMMKSVGQNFAAVSQSSAQRDYETAKGQVTRSREQLAVTITFWRDRKKDDAIRMLRATLAKMDDLDEALSAEKIDPASVETIARQIDVACQACHAAYREQDPVSKAYRFKSGSLQ